MDQTFRQLQRRAMQIAHRYGEKNQAEGRKEWDPLAYAAGLEGYRQLPNAKGKLEHELGDCLWSLFIIAEVYHIDLQQAFLTTMDELEQRLA